jgi:hypothetical protein
MRSLAKFLILLFALSILLSACNLPTPTPQTAPLTVAAQTIQAQLTADAARATPVATFTPQPIPTIILPSPITPPTVTLTPTPVCDLAFFVNDVTIPDGSQILVGQTFVKTWRLRNLGTCTWTSGYQLIFDSGDLMGATSPQPLTTGTVAPGQTVDISITLTAPATPGSYRGYWRIRNPAGVLMPVASGYQGTSFFVDIKAIPPTPTNTPTFTPTATSTPTP